MRRTMRKAVVTLAKATTALREPLAATIDDPDHFARSREAGRAAGRRRAPLLVSSTSDLRLA